MSEIFHLLRQAGIIRRGKVVLDTIARKPLTQLLDVIDKVADITSKIPEVQNFSGKIHCASINLSGGHDGCDSLECRQRRIDELARFAALYSDHVLFHNFLANIAPSFGHPPETDNVEVRDKLYSDFVIFSRLRPLIEAGILVPYSTPTPFCPTCFVSSSVSEQAGRRVKKARKILSKEFLAQLSVEVKPLQCGYSIECSGIDSLFDHGPLYYHIKELPEPIAKRSRLITKLKKNETIVIPKTLIQELMVNNLFAGEVLNNAAYQMAVSELTGASFLTKRTIDIDVLSHISGDGELIRKNSVLSRNWRIMVPFAGDVPIRDLIRLRKREAEAFVQFRDALDKAIRDAVAEGDALSDKIARSVYSDILAPEICRLEQRVKEAKRNLVKMPLASAAGITAAIGLGIYSGMLAGEFAVVAKALGIGKVTYDTVATAAKLADVRDPVRREKFYYLWRVRHAVRKIQH